MTVRLTETDQELITKAREVIETHFEPRRHGVGTALQTQSGEVFIVVHLETDIGRAAICAEPIASGKAITAGERNFETIVAVIHPGRKGTSNLQVIPPCGICRELIFDYDPETVVITVEDNEAIRRPIAELIPGKPY